MKIVYYNPSPTYIRIIAYKLTIIHTNTTKEHHKDCLYTHFFKLFLTTFSLSMRQRSRSPQTLGDEWMVKKLKI